MKLVIIGKTGSGKGQVAYILEEVHKFKRYSITDLIKQELEKSLHEYEIDLAVFRHTAELARYRDKLYWVRKLWEKIVHDGAENLDIVVHGVYYPEEVKFFEQKKFKIIKVEIEESVRLEKIRKIAGLSKEPDTVLQEPPYLLEKYRTKYTLINRGPDELSYEVKLLLDKLYAGK